MISESYVLSDESNKRPGYSLDGRLVFACGKWSQDFYGSVGYTRGNGMQTTLQCGAVCFVPIVQAQNIRPKCVNQYVCRPALQEDLLTASRAQI